MSGSNVTFRHLRAFLEIVAQRSLRRAAHSLHITESAVSKSLRELEDELGCALLLRDRKGVTLTPEGVAFHRHATQTSVSLARALEVGQHGPGVRGLVRVGALPTAAGGIVPHVVHALTLRFPEIEVSLHAASYEQLIAQLRLGEIDLIVGRMVPRDTLGLSFERLYDEDVVAAVRRGHPLTHEASDVVHALNSQVVITAQPGSLVRQAVEDFLYTSSVKPQPRLMSVQSDAFARAYVYRHDAVWFAPRGQVQVDLQRGWMQTLPLQSHLLRATIGLTLQAGQPLSETAELFVGLLRELSPVSAACVNSV